MKNLNMPVIGWLVLVVAFSWFIIGALVPKADADSTGPLGPKPPLLTGSLGVDPRCPDGTVWSERDQMCATALVFNCLDEPRLVVIAVRGPDDQLADLASIRIPACGR